MCNREYGPHVTHCAATIAIQAIHGRFPGQCILLRGIAGIAAHGPATMVGVTLVVARSEGNVDSVGMARQCGRCRAMRAMQGNARQCKAMWALQAPMRVPLRHGIVGVRQCGRCYLFPIRRSTSYFWLDPLHDWLCLLVVQRQHQQPVIQHAQHCQHCQQRHPHRATGGSKVGSLEP